MGQSTQYGAANVPSTMKGAFLVEQLQRAGSQQLVRVIEMPVVSLCLIGNAPTARCRPSTRSYSNDHTKIHLLAHRASTSLYKTTKPTCRWPLNSCGSCWTKSQNNNMTERVPEWKNVSRTKVHCSFQRYSSTCLQWPLGHLLRIATRK